MPDLCPRSARRTWLAFAFALALAACGGKPAVMKSPAATPPAPPPPTAPPPTAPTTAVDFAVAAAADGFVFEAPVGFTPVAIRDNADVAYDHAVASADGRIELRYALRPYPTDLAPAMRSRQFSSTFFLTAILNLIRGGESGDATEAQAVDAQGFGADEATMTLVRWHGSDGPADAFGTGFQFAAVLYLHKDGLGDGYLFAMFRDVDAVEQMAESLYHTLRFAPAPAP